MDIFKKLANENIEDYILRLSKEKKLNKTITWQGIAEALEPEFNIIRSEAWVRRKVKTIEAERDIDTSLSIQELQQKLLELKKEKVKIADERVQINAHIKKLARIETYKEIALEAAQEVSKIKILPKYTLKENFKENKEAILCIGDWHYGLDFKNPWNEFNPEICKERVAYLKDKTIQYIIANKCKHLHLVNLQDLIAGRIHLSLRLESRYDVITQTIHVSEILAEFITSISKYIPITYYDCLDNHSRLEPNIKDAQDSESLARIIPWYLKERLKENENVTFKENVFGHDIITFETMGHKVMAVHGDKDTPNKCIDNLSLLTRDSYSLICMAHRHHFSMDEKDQCRLLCNGSLMGSDGYALKLRLHSKPSQTLIIASEKNVCESIHIIEL